MLKKFLYSVILMFAISYPCFASTMLQLERIDTGEPVFTVDFPTGTIYAAPGILDVHETFIDVLAASSSSIRNSDNYIRVTTATLVANGTTWTNVEGSTTTDVPRTVSLILFSTVTAGVAGAGQGWTSSCTWHVRGTNAQGDTIDELVTSTANALVYTTNAFSKLTSVSLFVSTFSKMDVLNYRIVPTQVYFSTYPNVMALIGTGPSIGLANQITWSNDVYKVKEANGGVSLTDSGLIINCTGYTVDFHTEPDGIMDYEVWYKARKR